MKKRIYLTTIIIASLFLTSCGSSKVTSYKKTGSKKVYTSTKKSETSEVYRSKNIEDNAPRNVNRILKTAKSYLGTPYKYGGVTNTGFDCSGLVYVSFKELNLDLPRRSSDQAEYGKEINIENVKIGDLIFFNTSGNSISHVGIVESINRNGSINFVHSSTSKGVIISSLDENYWKSRFVKAMRLL
ncbi:C40 family peptidase [Empedobacter tilapiae]|uniref:NlpC/P60 family protein n=1 Tax=Empedobacter tilapiae TaxID=2491114 RepID=A0A4Z1BM08_9FLAO|nr:C40 family peptidase [Empedobacter tilapiae]TGN23105.1 NlpC/P60 family protein [Empedobacter tilapiae]